MQTTRCRSACTPAVLSAPLFLESVNKKSEILLEFQIVWICPARSEPELSANVISHPKNDSDEGPSPDQNPWIHALTACTDPVSGDSGPMTVAVFVFNFPPTAYDIWRKDHGLKSHPTDW